MQMNIRSDYNQGSTEGGIRVCNLCLRLSGGDTSISLSIINPLYLRLVYRSIIHHYDRLWLWIRVAEWEKLIFDVCIEGVTVDGPGIDTACDISIHCH
jgi:hypothetical protein